MSPATKDNDMTSATNTLLRGENLTKKFDGLVAVDGISFELEPGRIYGLIGPNGAGKSTLFNLITGYNEPTEGTARFQEKDITSFDPEDVNKIGIGRTFQLVRPFRGMTVYENTKAGAYFGQDGDISSITEQSLRQVGLWESREKNATTIPLASQKKLEIARSLATGPELLLVDEPLAGLNATETNEMIEMLRDIRDDGVTIWIIEHDMQAVMDVCDHIYVLESGSLIANDSPEEVANNDRVIEAYLGSEFEEGGNT
jgi:branched-chain amino acid transport system ATP-binding protein